MKRIVLAGICLFLLSSNAFSQIIYVTDKVTVMFRSGPGNDRKILKTVSSGEKLAVVETLDRWTLVRRVNEEEGWVLNQWLSEDVPKSILLGSLEKKHEQLLEKFAKLKAVNGEAEDENKNLKATLAITRKKERDSSNAYENLKKSSANYLKLEADYKVAKKKLEKLGNEADILNDQLTQKNITWFLIGAGVLFLGIILGFNSKRQRRSSY